MSLLLKQSPLVSQLVLYDVVNTAGVAADISHVETPAQVHRVLQSGTAIIMSI